MPKKTPNDLYWDAKEKGEARLVIDADAIATRLIHFWEKDIEAEYERRSQMPAPGDATEPQ